MEWIVQNAINRDVERQHLNKILKDIRKTVDESSAQINVGDSNIKDIVGQMVSNNLEYGLSVTYDNQKKVLNFGVNDFSIRLQGDVTGSGTVRGLSSVTIDATIDPSKTGIGDAPEDNYLYWRVHGQWVQVDTPVYSLGWLTGVGIPMFNDTGNPDTPWVLGEIVGTATEIDVTNGDGAGGNPTIGVAPEIRQGVARVPFEAATTIHGRRAVAVDSGTIYHPDLGTPADAVRVIGISLQAGSATDTVEVQTAGPITDASWTWSAGPVYVDDDGVLTQTAPATGWIVCIGTATAADTIDVRILLPILRS